MRRWREVAFREVHHWYGLRVGGMTAYEMLRRICRSCGNNGFGPTADQFYGYAPSQPGASLLWQPRPGPRSRPVRDLGETAARLAEVKAHVGGGEVAVTAFDRVDDPLVLVENGPRRSGEPSLVNASVTPMKPSSSTPRLSSSRAKSSLPLASATAR